MGDVTPEYHQDFTEDDYQKLIGLHENDEETIPQNYARAFRHDMSTEEEDDDIEITLSNARAAGIEPAAVTAVTTTLKAPKPAVVLTPAFTNPLLKVSDFEDTNLATSYPIFEYDIEKGEKPWKKPGADISDYFNYGFSEDTWKIYCEKQRRMRIETASMRRVIGEQTSGILPNPMNPSISSINPFPPIQSSTQNQFESGISENQRYQMKSEEFSNVPQIPFQFPAALLPPGLTLNLSPEMATSIAEMVASQLGLPSSFIAQLPPLQDLIAAGFNPQTLFPQFCPASDMQTMPPDLVPETNPDKKSISPSEERRERLSPDRKKRIKSNQIELKTKEKSRDDDRSKGRRNRSRSRERIRDRKDR